MGFLDLNGDLGRMFGSVGVSLAEIKTRVTLRDLGKTPKLQIHTSGDDAERAEAYATLLCKHFGINRKLELAVDEAVTPHSGLGSGTQLALAVGTALCDQFNIASNARELAILLGRGRRSAIGIQGFEQGGFHIDCGSRADGNPPHGLVNLEFPDEWRFLLLFDHLRSGVHGTEEKEAFQTLQPMPASTAAELCRLVLMQLVPGLIERDIKSFGEAVTQLQNTVGDHFAPVQGGRYASSEVAEMLEWFGTQGAAGLGQSSWGPTGFVLCADENSALRMAQEARAARPENSCDIQIVRSANQPALTKSVRSDNGHSFAASI